LSTYTERVNSSVERYTSLVKYAERLTFPKCPYGLPENVKNWHMFRKFIHKLSHPVTATEGSVWEMLCGLILTFDMAAVIVWGVMFLAPALLGMPPFLTFSHLTGSFLIFFALLFAALLAPVAYYWWYDILTDKQYSPLLRVILIIAEFILVRGFSQTLISGSSTKQLVGSRADILPFLISYIIFLIPAFTYLLILVLDTIIMASRMFISLFGGIRSMYDPLPLVKVKRLALEEIPAAREGEPPWKLNSLSLHEIQTLRKWAEANRESTDKRILPAIVVIAFLTLLLSTDTVRSMFDLYIQNWLQRMFSLLTMRTVFFSKEYFLSLFIFAITIFTIVFLVKTFSPMFVNLAVQSLVIEACILAENSHDENYPVVATSAPSPRLPGLWRLLQRIIDFFQGKSSR